MVRIQKIYTRTGDDGTTGLVGGKRVLKSSLRVDAYGDIDELNAHLGVVIASLPKILLSTLGDKLKIIQNELFDIGSELAAPSDYKTDSLPLIESKQVLRLEEWIDSLSGHLPELTSFVLPGGHPTNANLHVARTVCRRAERSLLKLHQSEPVRGVVLQYLNRLSDILFSMARASSQTLEIKEILWAPASTRETSSQ